MLPQKARFIIETLKKHGYEAYAVGGCVRDILRGVTPHDVDITTSALPHETKEVFSDFRVIETGIAHGTVTVMVENEPFEVTTFRCDGEYLDARHPESVTFTLSVEEDLARRDFTVNSMAMDDDGKIIDPFGGIDDLNNRIIRCTGDPETRFSEDALRIMRALRFSSVLGFEIEERTAAAIHKKRELLTKISVERIFAELKKLLCGKNVATVLLEYVDVICTIIPEMAPAVGFDQKSKYHLYDVYEHIVRSVEAIPEDPLMRLTMFFHDIGKPYVYFEDEEGVGHFWGHPDVSADYADKILERLHSDSFTKDTVVRLCRWHDRDIIPDERHVKRLFLSLTYGEIIMLCHIRLADGAAQNPELDARGKQAGTIMEFAKKIHEEKQCVSLADLEVSGHDMIELGYKGVAVGTILNLLLSKVIDGELENKREILIGFARDSKD